MNFSERDVLRLILSDYLSLYLHFSGPISIVLMISGVIFYKNFHFFKKISTKDIFINVPVFLIFICLVFYFLEMVRYLFFQTYFDWIEANVVNIAYLGMMGNPLYPDPAAGAIYGLPYGPATFLINGLVLMLAPTLWGGKLAGIIAGLCSLEAGWLLFCRVARDRTVAFLMLGTLALLLVGYGQYGYWCRPEPFLLLLAILGLLAMVAERGIRAVFLLGLLAGLALDFKIHAVLYLIAPFFTVLYGINHWKNKIFCIFIFSFTVIAVGFLPFLLPVVSLDGYIQQLKIVSVHQFDPAQFIHNMMFSSMFMVTLLLLNRGRSLIIKAEAWVFLSVGMIVWMIIILIGSKEGAGFHHLLPLIPTGLMSFHMMMKAPAAKPLPPQRTVWAGLFLVTFIANLPGFVITPSSRMMVVAGELEERASKAAEVMRFLAVVPGAEMGITDRSNELEFLLSPLAVFSSHHRYHDPGAFMDLFQAGQRDPHLIPLFTSCDVPAWIMPAGKIFNFTTYYKPETLLYEPIVAETFLRTHRKIIEGKYYSLWACQKAA